LHHDSRSLVVDARDSRLRTPLHCAASVGNIKAVELLLDCGADVLVRDVTGASPLHLSVSAAFVSHRPIDDFVSGACPGGKNGKGFPYSIPSVGPAADPGVQAVSPQVTVSHPPGRRLPLLSARPAVTSPAAEHHCPLASTKLCCLVTEAHRYKQLAQGCYAALPPVGFEPATY